MAQFLTYPYGVKYQFTDWTKQVKQGTGGSLPCNNEIYEGKSIVTHNGTQWWGSGNGNTGHDWGSPDAHCFNQNLGGRTQKGLHYWIKTSSNTYRQSRWFDIGAEGGKDHGVAMGSGARSSWLRDVTALWCMVNGYDTTENRDCYGAIEKAALRYRDPNGKIAIFNLTTKLGDLSYEQWIRGAQNVMFGYALSSADRNLVCSQPYHFLGIRVQLVVKRGASGPYTDTLQVGINGIRLGLGANPTGAYNTTAKRALVLAGNQTWQEYNAGPPYKLETR